MSDSTPNEAKQPSRGYDPDQDYFVLLTAGCLAFGLTGVVVWLDGGRFGALYRIALSAAVVLIIRAMILHRGARRSVNHDDGGGDSA